LNQPYLLPKHHHIDFGEIKKKERTLAVKKLQKEKHLKKRARGCLFIGLNVLFFDTKLIIL
jgi:hypothetical protein